MKLTQTRISKTPVYGDRSIGYFGLAALMDQDYFNTTRDRATGPPRPDPRIKYFNPNEQFEIRQKIIDAGIKFGRTMTEIEDEWRKCLIEATNAATNYIRSSVNLEILDFIPYDKPHIEIVKNAYKVGRRKLEGEVAPRLAREDEWMTPLFPEFDFGNESGEVIYVFKQAIHSKETDNQKAYKIGRTRNFKMRNNTHRTSNTDLELIEIIQASENITEAAIHALFANFRFEREWFLLSDNQIELLKNRSKLSTAISNNNLQDNAKSLL